jgi:Uncharacterized protein conserved in bacteria
MKTTRRTVLRSVALAAMLPALLGTAQAQAAYPEQPIRIIVPYAPGGGADLLARAIGQVLGDRLGQPVIVENRAGAGATIGTDTASRAKPDGYTLLMASPSHSINATLYPNLKFDAEKDFVPITLAASGPLVLVVSASSPADSAQSFIEQARKQPGTINYASAGVGSTPHLAGELLKMQAKIDMVHVAYKGTAPALADLLGGQVQVMLAPVPTVLEHVRAGRLKALAVTSTQPFPALPDVPALAASGVPGYEVLQWWGLMAPAGTPQEIVTKLNQEIAAILRTDAMRERLDKMGAEPGGQSPEDFGRLIHEEIVKWAAVIKAAGITAE